MSRDRSIRIRVSESEKNRIESRAQDAGLSVSEYLRRMALEGEVSFEQVPTLNQEQWQKLSKLNSNLSTLASLASERSIDMNADDFERVNEMVYEIRDSLIGEIDHADR